MKLILCLLALSLATVEEPLNGKELMDRLSDEENTVFVLLFHAGEGKGQQITHKIDEYQWRMEKLGIDQPGVYYAPIDVFDHDF